MKKNPELELAYEFVNYTNRNVFLTGKAGTGKTTFLHNLKKESLKRMIVVAPTGVAAINAGGVTIHSFFQMPFGPVITNRLGGYQRKQDENSYTAKFNRKKIDIIRSLDLLVIDEISMVRADMLDGIDEVLRKYKNRFLAFGGVQLLMIGDLQQLAPIAKKEEWDILRSYYDSIYFFSSLALRESAMVNIELKHVYRQEDARFIKILNEIRDNCLSSSSAEELNKRYKPDFDPLDEEGYIRLTTHNATANQLNESKLAEITKQEHLFRAEIKGLFPEYNFPTEPNLKLKEGAQVMFIKNDSSPEKRYFNGKIGRICSIEEGVVEVMCEGDDFPIEVSHEIWENVKYKINEENKEIEEEVIGTFKQIPLRLAWAITIHKSQGLSFDRAIIDSQAAFAHGQTYVALSRCRSLEGLVLSSRISDRGIICDQQVRNYNQKIEENAPDREELSQARNIYEFSIFEELFGLKQIRYHIDMLYKSSLENKQVLTGNILDISKTIAIESVPALFLISEKFIRQLKAKANEGICLEKDEKTLERIHKAAEYFKKNIETGIIGHIEDIHFESDNRAINKKLNESIDKINELGRIKIKCFGSVLSGFTIQKYLNDRAVAILDKPQKAPAKRQAIDKESIEHPELYEILKQWRNALASENGVPVFYILPTHLMAGIATYLPKSEKDLFSIRGMGKKKMEQYGHQILEIVQDYCFENKVKTTQPTPASPEKSKKIDSKKESFELFQKGMNISEIASERGLIEKTIEKHLTFFIEKGKIDISFFIKKEPLTRIIAYFDDNGADRLNPAKEHFGEAVSYRDLQFCRAYFKYISGLKE